MKNSFSNNKRNMYKPTEEELLEMGFKKDGNKYVSPNIGDCNDYVLITYHIEYELFSLEIYYKEASIFPESIEDIKTLIRLFKLK